MSTRLLVAAGICLIIGVIGNAADSSWFAIPLAFVLPLLVLAYFLWLSV
jgi:hypothetical protein